MNTTTPAVAIKGLTKRFGSLTANDAIDLTVYPGEIHSLLGENGAGKTTLMNCLFGMISHDEGTIAINGKEVHIGSSRDAINLGIGMVHQHFKLVETFTTAENIVLGAEPKKGIVLDRKAAREQVRKISEEYGLKIDPDAVVQDISVGQQQRVEILKALFRGAEILILDEPTAVLTPQETEELAKILESLRQAGKTIIIITHKLNEIKMMAQRVTIIRRGKVIDSLDVAGVSEQELAEKMVGRSVSFRQERGEYQPGDVLLKVQDLKVLDDRKLPAVDGLSLELRSHEILGIAGVDGNGQRELIEGLTGLRKVESGAVELKGEQLHHPKPRDIHVKGMGHIPSDRRKHGLVLQYDLAENTVLKDYYKEPHSKGGFLQKNAITAYAQKLIDNFDVRPPVPTAYASSLSGGNQQKVIIAREVTADPDVLVASQPTRGLDVGAIEFVHRALLDQRDRGKAVLLVSMELEEILNLSDRIAVMYEGKIVAVMDREDADEQTLGLYMAGSITEAQRRQNKGEPNG